MSNWKTIDTVPKDGSVVLAWRYYPVVIRWDADDAEWRWKAVLLGGYCGLTENAFQEGDAALTHWMPLPSSPQGDKP